MEPDKKIAIEDFAFYANRSRDVVLTTCGRPTTKITFSAMEPMTATLTSEGLLVVTFMGAE